MQKISSIVWRVKLGVVFCLVLIATLSCNSSKNTARDDSAWVVVQESTQGVLHLTVRVDKQQLSVAQNITLELRAEVDEDYRLQFPQLVDNVEGFYLRDSNLSKPVLLANKRLEIRTTYLLEPDLPGEYRLPSVSVSAWKQGQEDSGIDEVQVDEIPITVTSLLKSDEQQPMISDVAPPVAAPWSRWLLAVIGGVLLFCGVLLYWWFKRQKNKKELPPPPVPAHIKAHRELDLLLAEGLLMRGEVKEFYAALSNILRHYIEHRFTIKAPERTTEEFLAELGTVRGRPRLSSAVTDLQFVGSHKIMLHEFLSRCDLVKFARHRPLKEEIEGGVAVCRKFIDQTTSPSTADVINAATPQTSKEAVR